MSVAEALSLPRPRLPARLLRGVRNLVIGGLLCLTPLTSILALGWIVRRMRAAGAPRTGRPSAVTGWILGPAGQGRWKRLLGGLVANLREGLSAALSLALASATFGLPWLVAWWAGWDNSFNKGYEQANVGQLIFLCGIAVYLIVATHLPLALAHQAVTGRWLAVFEWRAVRRVQAHSGWGLVFLTLATLLFALPLFLARTLPVFAEGIDPGFADMTPPEVAALRDRINLAVAFHVFAGLWWLRVRAARLHARASIRAESGLRPSRLGRLLHSLIITSLWLGLMALIVIGQFLNHSWWAWVQNPLFLLPWYH